MSESSKRWKIAAAGLGALLLVLSVLGALASAGEDHGPVQGAVGAPRVGDQVAYRSENPHGWTAYAWNGTVPAMDALGRNVTAYDLRTQGDRDAAPRHVLYLPGSRAPFAERSVSDAESEGSQVRVRQDVRYGERVDLGLEENHPCLLVARWQGVDFQRLLGQRLDVLCPSWQGAGNATVQRVAAEAFDGRPAVRVEVGDAWWTQDVLWFADGEPYPLASLRCGGPDCTPQEAHERGAVRVAYARGTGALLDLKGAPAPLPARPEADFGPVTREGPMDGGLGPYRLADAIRNVEADASLKDFQAWRAAHPDAILVEASAYFDFQPPTLPSTGARAQSWALAWLAPDLTAQRVQTDLMASCAGAEPSLPTTPLSPCVSNQMTSVHVPARWPSPLPARSLTFQALAREVAPQVPDGEKAVGFGWRLEADPQGSVWESMGVSIMAPQDSSSPSPAQDLVGGSSGTWERGWQIDASDGTLQYLSLYRASPEAPMAAPPPMPPSQAASAGPSLDLASAGPAATILVDGYPILGAASVALLVGSLLAPRLPALAVALYTRLTRQDVTEHPRRAAILGLLRERPGTSTGEIAVRLAAGEGATRHHLDVLMRAGIVTRLPAGGSVHWFLAGSLERGRLARRAVLESGGAEARALTLIERDPGIHAAQLARELDVSRPAMHFTLRRLAAKGLVREEREGARRRVFAVGENAVDLVSG